MTERPSPEYASFDGYQFWLHLGSHDSPPLVALEPEVLVRLRDYVRKIYKSYNVESPI